VWKENFFPAKNRFFGRIQKANQEKIGSEYRRYYDVIQEFSRVIQFQEQGIEERWNKLIKYFNKRTETINELFGRNSKLLLPSETEDKQQHLPLRPNLPQKMLETL